jgi:hypothetical protein
LTVSSFPGRRGAPTSGAIAVTSTRPRADDAAYRPASCISRAFRDGGYADDGRIEVGSL